MGHRIIISRCRWCDREFRCRADGEQRFCGASCFGADHSARCDEGTAHRLAAKAVQLPSGCHEWSGARSEIGYGRLNFHGRTTYAHRVRWIISHGEIPKGLYVCHSCDNPPCVNIDHLFLGTTQDNIADMVRKGRHTVGVRNPQAKLNPGIVREIRRMREAGTLLAVIAERFGVSEGAASLAARKLTWRNVA